MNKRRSTLCLTGLLVLLLGLVFPRAGSLPDVHPGCRLSDRLHPRSPLDVVMFWENTTLRSGAPEDEGLRYVLRSFTKFGLDSRATRLHLVCDDAVGPPHFLRPYLAATPYGASGCARVPVQNR